MGFVSIARSHTRTFRSSDTVCGYSRAPFAQALIVMLNYVFTSNRIARLPIYRNNACDSQRNRYEILAQRQYLFVR